MKWKRKSLVTAGKTWLVIHFPIWKFLLIPGFLVNEKPFLIFLMNEIPILDVTVLLCPFKKQINAWIQQLTEFYFKIKRSAYLLRNNWFLLFFKRIPILFSYFRKKSTKEKNSGIILCLSKYSGFISRNDQ